MPQAAVWRKKTALEKSTPIRVLFECALPAPAETSLAYCYFTKKIQDCKVPVLNFLDAGWSVVSDPLIGRK